jgi:hypothetical protein
MASPTLVIDPSDVARRVESNLRVVWRGSQRVNLSVCVHMCIYVYELYNFCECLMWWNFEILSDLSFSDSNNQTLFAIPLLRFQLKIELNFKKLE